MGHPVNVSLCFPWSLPAFALPVLCSQILPSVLTTGAGLTRAVSDPLVFQVALVIIQKWKKPGADLTAANTSPSNLCYCPGPRNGQHKTKLKIILFFSSVKKDLFFLLQLCMFETIFTHLYIGFSSWQIVPTKHVVILRKVIVLLWKRIFLCAVLLLSFVF